MNFENLLKKNLINFLTFLIKIRRRNCEKLRKNRQKKAFPVSEKRAIFPTRAKLKEAMKKQHGSEMIVQAGSWPVAGVRRAHTAPAVGGRPAGWDRLPAGPAGASARAGNDFTGRPVDSGPSVLGAEAECARYRRELPGLLPPVPIFPISRFPLFPLPPPARNPRASSFCSNWPCHTPTSHINHLKQSEGKFSCIP